MINKKALIFTLAALVWAAPLWAKLIDGIAVVANQETMTQGELEESIQAYFLGQGQKVPAPKSPDYEKARQAVLNGFIEEVALATEADNEKIEVPDSEIDHAVDQQIDDMKKGYATEEEFNKALDAQGMALDDLKQDLRSQLARRLKAQHMLRQKQSELPDSLVVSDDQAQQYYTAHAEDYDQAHFSIILFRVPAGSKPDYVKDVKAQAQQVLDQLRAGGDFAAAAKKYSEDQGTSDKGGDIGTVSKTELEPRLAKGVFATPVGGLSLVSGADGIYIVKVISRGQADFSAVASEIKDELRKGNQDQALKDWVESLKKKVYVEYSKNLTAGSVSALPYDSLNTASAPVSEAPAVDASANTTTASTPDSNAVTDSSAVSVAAGDSVSVQKAPVYSPLPEEGNITIDLTLSPWFYGTSDLAQNYKPGTDVGQGFPLGLEANVGLELTLDSQLQFGALLQVMDKFEHSVTDSTGTKGVWEESAVGLIAGPRFLLPLVDGLNLDLYAQGGYYFLFGNTVAFSGTNNGTLYLDGSNFGGQLGADLEIFLDDEKTFTLDLGVGYRRLLVNPTVKGGVTGYALPGYQVDFSGLKTIAGFRFYVDK
jgi:foldase protein PrsA